MSNKTIAIIVAGMLLSAPALAREQSQRGEDERATIRALESRAHTLQRRAGPQRIGAVERDRITKQRKEIQDLIDRLESGQPVDSQELDRVLGR
jgi:hypothetical protein